MKKSKFFFLMIPIFLLFGLNCLDAGQQPLYTTENQFLNEIIPSRSPSQKITSPQSYIECEPIDITSDFQLNNSGFKGNGTIDDPILIEGYNITYSSGSLIYISGTTYYFRIANNLLNGMTTAEYGIDLHNVQNGVIVNNTIRDFFRYSIRFGDPAGCNNNVIANNTICDNGLHGIWTGDSHYNIIEGNTIYNNGGMGIILGSSEYNIIQNNIVSDSMWGLEICLNSNYNTIYNNTFHHSPLGIGLYLSVSGNNISSNKIYSNYENGIDLTSNSDNNTISNNTVYNNGMDGITLSNSDNNTISNNIIFNNGERGVNIESGCDDNIIRFNDLKGNNAGGRQATDAGADNIFTNNYWSEWSGIGSHPIDGSAGNHDLSPLTNPFHLSAPIITGPTAENLTLSENVTIQWTASTDKFGHAITYSVFYSTNDGGNWTTLASGLTTTNYPFDTTSIADGTNLLLKFHAIDSIGFVAKTVSTEAFLIANTPHQLSSPAILTPQDREALTGSVDITWSPAEDTWAHTITYTIYYSSDEGTTWIQFATGHTSTSYLWDTTTIPDGLKYMLKVNAICDEGLITESPSKGPFMIHNGPSVPTISSPNGGETLSGVVTIEWDASIDTFNHTVTYSVYFSSNNGATWTQLAFGLTTTNYMLNTTRVPNGFSNLIKIMATCSEGNMAEDISDSTFAIQNVITTSTTTSIVNTSTTSVSIPGLSGILILGVMTLIIMRKSKK